MKQLALVLHSHLPWLRRNGTFPVGEEWLFQSWSESYLPVLDVLERLAEEGHRDLLTIGFTPVLVQQMTDPYLLSEFHGWLGRRLCDLQWTRSAAPAHDKAALQEVWTHHWRRQRRLLARVEHDILRRGLIAPFADLADAGVIELLGGPATHPYLPLADDAALINRQMHEGLVVGTRAFGQQPTGVWTPECGYRPAGPVGDPTAPPLHVAPDGTPSLRPSGTELDGLETFWQEAGVDHLVLDGPTLARAAGARGHQPGGRSAGGWSSLAGQLHDVGDLLDVLDAPVLIGDSDVAAFGRNLAVSYAVWNPTGGYPADIWYRDFHMIDLEGGYKSWRVTDTTSLAKQPYVPAAARARVSEHARDFITLLHRHLDPRGKPATVTAAYDTELFGHWWYEGPLWLEEVLRRLVADPVISPTTLKSSLQDHQPTRRLALPESSWGKGKGHAAWVSEDTRWIWQALREAEATFAGLDDPVVRKAAWRQLSLLQASDWPFMINHEQSAGYAVERVKTHLARFSQAAAGERLAELSERDEPGRLDREPPRAELTRS